MRDRWAVILAGGDGTRLQSMTRAITGDNRPKQFVPVIGGSTLLDQTRRRVAFSIEPSRTLIVVTQKHRRFYESVADEISPSLLLEQPVNKGTAPAILYALLRVATKSPKAIVALFPSDHFFTDDEEFMSHIDVAIDAVKVATCDRDAAWNYANGRRKQSTDGLSRSHRYSRARKNQSHGSRKFWEKPSSTSGDFPDGARLLVEQFRDGRTC